MRVNVSKILFVVFIITSSVLCYSQTNHYYVENLKRINDCLNGPQITNMCKGVITYTAKYKSSRVKSDAFIVSFINLVIDNKITSDDITIRLMKLGHKKAVVVEEYFNGLIKTRHILLKGNYLRANIILGFIDNSIVRAKVRLITRTHPECAEYGELIMDFKLLKDFFIKDAKLLFAVEYDEMVSDTIYSNNLSSISKQRRDYKFNIPSYIVDS